MPAFDVFEAVVAAGIVLRIVRLMSGHSFRSAIEMQRWEFVVFFSSVAVTTGLMAYEVLSTKGWELLSLPGWIGVAITAGFAIQAARKPFANELSKRPAQHPDSEAP
jgi:hypothetical protein